MAKKLESVKIDEELVKALRVQKELTGKSITRMVEDAIKKVFFTKAADK